VMLSEAKHLRPFANAQGDNGGWRARLLTNSCAIHTFIQSHKAGKPVVQGESFSKPPAGGLAQWR
ncbi:MAG: hypothetical protein RMM08_13870, partial [Armatimonadota bacterium]|nr:hypothetical protein [Armatimonadota bacterium]